MSKRDWLSPTAVALSLLLGLLAILVFVGLWGLRQEHYCRSAHEPPAESYQINRDQRPFGETPHTPQTDQKSYWEQYARYQDLIAQQQMACSAYWTMGATWLGVILLFITVIEAVRTSKSAAAAAKAATIAAHAEVAEKSSDLQVKAIEFHSIFGGLLTEDQRPIRRRIEDGQYKLRFDRIGSTRVKVKKLEFGHHIGHEFPPLPPRYPLERPYIFTDPIGSRNNFFTFELRLTPEEIEEVDNANLWIFGRIVFEDYIGREKRQPFCGRLLCGFTGNEPVFMLNGPDEYTRPEYHNETGKNWD